MFVLRFLSRQRLSKDKSAGRNKGASARAKMESGEWSGGREIQLRRERDREREREARQCKDLETDEKIEIGKGTSPGPGTPPSARKRIKSGCRAARLTNPKLTLTVENIPRLIKVEILVWHEWYLSGR